MRRLYYLANDIETTDAISKRLHKEGVTDWNFHVLAKDPQGLYTHQIHSALPHHHKDLIRTGEIGALYGAAVSGLLAVLIWQYGSWAWLATWIDVLMLTCIGLLVGGLAGIRVGFQRDSTRLQSFDADIEAGRFLIMVDVQIEDKPVIRELMNMEFPQVAYRGNESTFVRPFKSPDLVLPRDVDQIQRSRV